MVILYMDKAIKFLIYSMPQNDVKVNVVVKEANNLITQTFSLLPGRDNILNKLILVDVNFTPF